MCQTLKGFRSIIGTLSQSLSKVLIHTIFSTENHEPYLKNLELRAEMHAYLGGKHLFGIDDPWMTKTRWRFGTPDWVIQ